MRASATPSRRARPHRQDGGDAADHLGDVGGFTEDIITELSRFSEMLDEVHAAEVLRIQPNFTIEGTLTRLALCKNALDAEHYFDGLRKAGLPER